jgi:hypothetical protein
VKKEAHIMRRASLALPMIAFAAVFAGSPAAAELQAEDASLVPLFLQTCTSSTMNAEALLSGVTGSSEWQEVPAPTVDLKALEKVPSTLTTGAFRKPTSVREWKRTVSGRDVRLVIAQLPAKNVYHNVCALFAPDIKNAMPYFDAFRDGMKAISLSGKSTDLPHYVEYGGRLADRRRAHADMYSRTQAMTTPRTMHMAIVFE